MMQSQSREGEQKTSSMKIAKLSFSVIPSIIVLAACLAVISEYHEVNRCEGMGYMPVATVPRYTEVV